MTAWMDPDVAARDWWRALVELVRGHARLLRRPGPGGHSGFLAGSTSARPEPLRRAA